MALINLFGTCSIKKTDGLGFSTQLGCLSKDILHPISLKNFFYSLIIFKT